MRQKTETLDLDCALDEYTVRQYLTKLSDLTNIKKDCFTTIEQKKQSYRMERRKIKKTIQTIEQTIEEINQKITAKTDKRPIECIIIYDFMQNKKSWYRTDTKALVKEIPIPTEELQEDCLENVQTIS
jgi:signal transduction protein with GAF and PtsI domain